MEGEPLESPWALLAEIIDVMLAENPPDLDSTGLGVIKALEAVPEGLLAVGEDQLVFSQIVRLLGALPCHEAVEVVRHFVSRNKKLSQTDVAQEVEFKLSARQDGHLCCTHLRQLITNTRRVPSQPSHPPPVPKPPSHPPPKVAKPPSQPPAPKLLPARARGSGTTKRSTQVQLVPARKAKQDTVPKQMRPPWRTASMTTAAVDERQQQQGVGHQVQAQGQERGRRPQEPAARGPQRARSPQASSSQRKMPQQPNHPPPSVPRRPASPPPNLRLPPYKRLRRT
mmetsp:Transcript_13594/g.30205  ORF Transcript_13594/g.30205 Transcript_13594/m.30205 type:complete len:283 (+) Transcript_13594:1-849(+)